MSPKLKNCKTSRPVTSSEIWLRLCPVASFHFGVNWNSLASRPGFKRSHVQSVGRPEMMPWLGMGTLVHYRQLV